MNMLLEQSVPEQSVSAETQAFEALLNFLLDHHNFDFTSYQRTSLMRQMRRRMEAVAIADYNEYLNYLKACPEEANVLFKSIPVNFTYFFRDQQVWSYIATKVIPRIISHLNSNQVIKIWSAGCASGEEAYTLAVLLLEAVGIERFKRQVRIYATDIKEEAIDQARQGIYSPYKTTGIPPAFLERYFEQTNAGYRFHPHLKSSIIFAQHNLLQDIPISKVDLLVCRNTLMYFNTEGRNRLLKHFYFSLKDNGFLLLGKAETLVADSRYYFDSFNLPLHLFTKRPKVSNSQELLLFSNHLTNRAALL